MARRKQATNYTRLDAVVAAMARRDDKLRKLLASAVEINGRRFLRASALAEYLGYASSQTFRRCIDNAQITASQSGVSIETNFIDSSIFDGEERDLFLSEWATYASLMEADSRLPQVAVAKSFFAAYAEARVRHEEARLRERQVAKKLHKRLHGAAEQAGIVSADDHAIFDDHGYRGMYGMSVADVERRKGVPSTLKLIDCADHTELAANNLRMSLAADKILEDQIRTKGGANDAHFKVGRIVRKAVEDAAGKPPEALPLAKDSVNELTKRKAFEMRQLPL